MKGYSRISGTAPLTAWRGMLSFTPWKETRYPFNGKPARPRRQCGR